LASKRDIGKLVLVTPFDSVQNVAQKIFPIYPMSIVLKDKHDSINRVKDIKAKTLIIVAQHDEVIKPNHTNRLFNKFPISQVSFLTIKGVDHDNISKSEDYLFVLHNFIENCD
jgi:esterase/lipase